MESVTRRIVIGVAFALVLLFGRTATWAQSNAATLTGTVVDKTGAVVPNAKIVVTEEASGVVRSITSDERGFFSLVGVPVSVYDVQVSAPGFNSLLRKGVAVHINDQIELKGIVLSVAATSISVVVTAEADELTPTTSGEVSYTISDTQLHNLNIEGRSAIELLGLIPGAANTGSFNGAYNSSSAGFTQNASSYTVNGNRFDQVALVSDGAAVSDLNTAGSAAVTPNVDMISELKVESAAYSSSQPNGPIVVSTQTKSGGRDYHGLIELTARNHALNAVDWQQKYNSLPAPQTSLFYPQIQFGGPVVPKTSKLFFFVASEISQQHVDLSPRKSQVPAKAGSPGYTGTGMANGDFTDSAYLSNLSVAASDWDGYVVGSQPCSGKYWNTNCLNAVGYGSNWGQISSIDKGGQILLNAIPAANVDPSLHGGYNLITDYTVSQPRNQEIAKIDYAISDGEHLSVRYNHENESVPSPYGPWNQWNNVPYPAAQTQKNASNSVNLNMTSVLTPALTNEASLGYTRFTLKTAIGNTSSLSRTALDYPYSNLFSTKNDLIPNVSFEKIAGGLYIAGGEAPSYLGVQNNITFNDGLTLLKGTHLFRAGFYAQVGRYNLLTDGTDNGSVDTEIYDSVTGNDWADLLIGNTSYFSQSSSNLKANMAINRYDLYVQDTWKASSKLTLNYGVRVDHIGWWYDKNGHIAVFVPADDTSKATADYSNFAGMESHSTNSKIPLAGSKAPGFQWAPSAGFAYDLTGAGKTVLRGGFGTSYYADPGNNAYSAIMAPPNFQVVSSWAGTTPYTLSGISSMSSTSVPPTVWGSADPKEHRVPVTYSWNLALSHVFWGANNVEVNYVGNSSHNLVGYGIQNAIPEGTETGPWYSTYYDEQARPYKNFGDISTHFHNLNSNYNALQLTVTRERGWLNYWGSYTFGKALAYNAEDAFDMKRCYGPAPFDRSQVVSFSYYLNLPNFGSKYLGNHKALNGITDGWKISGVFQAMTGGPIQNSTYNSNEYAMSQNSISIWGTVSNTVNGSTNNNISLATNGGAFTDGTPDEIAVPKMICDPRKGLAKNQYFNPACFVAPSYLANGTYRLPYIHGPAYINDSIGLFKAFAMGGSRKLEVRGEAFNLFNHPWNEFLRYDDDSRMDMGFSEPGGATSSTSAGTTDNKTGHREISLAAKFYF